MEQFMQYISDFSYPSAIIAAYIVITLTKQYTDVKPKYYLLIAVFTGILIVILEEILVNPITLKRIVAGALSGIIATLSRETINKIVKSKELSASKFLIYK